LNNGHLHIIVKINHINMNSTNLVKNLKNEISNISSNAAKKKIKSVFVISTTSKRVSQKWILLPSRETKYAICGVITIYDLQTAKQVAKYVDGKVDYVLVDAEMKLKNLENLVEQISQKVTKSKILTFKNNDLTVASADAYIFKILKDYEDKKISIIGAGNIGGKLSLKLVERGNNVYLASQNINKTRTVAKSVNNLKPKYCRGKAIPKDLRTISKNADLLIGFTPGGAIISSEMVGMMNNNGIILDGGVGTISQNAIKTASKKEIKILRLDIRAGFAGIVSLLFETERILGEIQGNGTLKGIDVVAGGSYGKYGDVILDNLTKPKKVIGIADGKGGVLRRKLSPTISNKLKIIKRLVEKGKKINND